MTQPESTTAINKSLNFKNISFVSSLCHISVKNSTRNVLQLPVTDLGLYGSKTIFNHNYQHYLAAHFKLMNTVNSM